MSEKLQETPSQTAGPYVHIGCTPEFAGISGVYPQDLGSQMLRDGVRGERITLGGVVYDGLGAPVRDAMVEIWQADADGFYPGNDPRGAADPCFSGWGRAASDQETGQWRFDTIRPGAVPFRDGAMMAPHVSLWIVARGINTGLQTRLYFPDMDEANAADPVLARIEHPDRVATLVARQIGAGMFHHDIYLQGPQETVFFDI